MKSRFETLEGVEVSEIIFEFRDNFLNFNILRFTTYKITSNLFYIKQTRRKKYFESTYIANRHQKLNADWFDPWILDFDWLLMGEDVGFSGSDPKTTLNVFSLSRGDTLWVRGIFLRENTWKSEMKNNLKIIILNIQHKKNGMEFVKWMIITRI